MRKYTEKGMSGFKEMGREKEEVEKNRFNIVVVLIEPICIVATAIVIWLPILSDTEKCILICMVIMFIGIVDVARKHIS